MGSRGGISDRLGLYGLVLREAARRVACAARWAVVRIKPTGGRAPDRLVIAPQDLRTTDPTVAADIYAGLFTFGGRTVETAGRSVFEIDPPSPRWAEALAGFGWLRHMRAADTAIAKANARALVDDFLRQDGDRKGIGAEPRIVARRLISFLSQSPLLLEGADTAFYNRFMGALGRGIMQLRRATSIGFNPDDDLIVAVALAYAGLCIAGVPRLAQKANEQLAETLRRDVLPDGGHISRNPRRLVELLTDLLPLRQTYAACGLEPPIDLLTAIDRMMPMLRMFRHGDGALALFNGMGVTSPDLLATLLAYDDARAQPLDRAPASGYERLVARRAVLVMDVGRPPPRPYSSEAHAGCLSFELSIGTCHLVVNCGAPATDQPALRLVARSTAAHSTVGLDDLSSCHFAGEGTKDPLGERLGRWIGPVVLNGPARIEEARTADEAGEIIAASHDGFRSRCGLTHQRTLRLMASGERVDGIDRFVGPGRARASVRFHLHPSVKASRSQDGARIMLLLPDGDAWSFEATDASPDLEESVYFAEALGARRTEQVVVTADVADDSEIHWRFLRLGRHRQVRTRVEGGPETDVLI